MVEKTDQADVLNAIVNRLISQIPEFNASTCFLSYEPVPPQTGAAGNLFCTVCTGDGQFNEGVFEGAGDEFLEEDGSVIVSVFSRIRTDRNDHAKEALTHASRGLLKYWKPLILKTLLADYELLDEAGDQILVNKLFPRTFTKPQMGDEGLIGFSITFDTDFDWDLE